MALDRAAVFDRHDAHSRLQQVPVFTAPGSPCQWVRGGRVDAIGARLYRSGLRQRHHNGFRPFRGSARLSGDRARFRPRRNDAPCAGVGRGRDLPGGHAAAGGGARFRRPLCARRCRRLGALAAGCGDHLRGAGAGLRVDRRLYFDPQHGCLDDRCVRQRGTAPALYSRPLHDEDIRELLPHRAGCRLRCREPAHARDARHFDHYVLNGAKAFISGGGTSDVYLVWPAPATAGRTVFPVSWSRTDRPGSRSGRRRRSSAGSRSRPPW